MPTCEVWSEENIVTTTWCSPLTAGELSLCFGNLAHMVGDKSRMVHVLFDIREAGAIPTQAPVLAIHSGFLAKANMGGVAVVSSDVIAEILARIAATVTHHHIRFFPIYDEALTYLNAAQVQALEKRSG